MKSNNMKKEYLFEDDRPFKSCHASSLVHLSNKDILVTWFAGTEEGATDVGIWCSRRTAGTWGRPYEICSEEGLPHWNPVLFKGDNGVLYLYYKVGHIIPEWYTKVIESHDEGITWSSPKELVKKDVGGRGPVRNKPIILDDGTWVAPASIEPEGKNSMGKKEWDSFVDISEDQGKTWIKSDLIYVDHSTLKSDGLIQPTLWESKPGHVHMLMRTSEGTIYRSDSQDSGKTWNNAYDTGLPNNNSGIDLTQLENGALVLIYNPVSINWGPRTPLVIRYSYDNGNTWIDEVVLETGKGEYSYPAIISFKNNVYITYTWNRERIAFWEIS